MTAADFFYYLAVIFGAFSVLVLVADWLGRKAERDRQERRR